jgi:hypothetical protein
MTGAEQASKSRVIRKRAKISQQCLDMLVFYKVMCIRLNNSLSTKYLLAAQVCFLLHIYEKQSSDSRRYILTLNQKDHLEFQP